MGGHSLHCFHTADFASTRPRCISVMNRLTQCISLNTLASHFSCMKPSPGLTATGCTLGQSRLHHHYQPRAKKVLTQRERKRERTGGYSNSSIMLHSAAFCFTLLFPPLCTYYIINIAHFFQYKVSLCTPSTHMHIKAYQCKEKHDASILIL